ncbi:MAG: FAD-dependent oxidoreductase [Ignavibacteriae bacterium]|nr:FAD-dependent oxidoreductase [Ignavibacteriota bacterium]MCB9244012.1 FAD-dependent oxidoreductase [Ignavibacteriales bacterium]
MTGNSEDFLNPKFGFTYADLYDTARLKDLNDSFHSYFKEQDNEKFLEFKKYADARGEGYANPDVSRILIESATFLSGFLGELFQIDAHLDKLLYETKYEYDVLAFKKDFVQKEITRKYKDKDPDSYDWDELQSFVNEVKSAGFGELDFAKDEEKNTATFAQAIVEMEKNYRWFYEGDKFAPENFTIPDDVKQRTENLLNKLKQDNLIPEAPELENLRLILQKIKDWLFVKYSKDPSAKKWISYFDPKKTDYDHLVEYITPDESLPNLMDNHEDHFRQRDGFKLNDFPRTERQLLNQVDYCMYCHEREKDSCSKGLTDRMGALQKNPLGNTLHGCPLEEKISEVHVLRREGYPLAAFSLILIDNPMCPGTGHRICNFCMKGCIFQKQEPVNIPLIESSILREVLALPYGFELYHLLTKWNPLNVKSPFEKSYNGKNVLVTGLGPAGYTLSHYLLNEGFGVVAVEGLKVEPIFEEYTLNDKSRSVPKPVKFFFDEIHRPLDTRVLQGFGGVSEYGITVRWDKNFLSVIYLSLCRRKNFKYYDGIDFGSSMTIADAWEFGFHHVALAAGAAKPTIINVKNNLIKGVRKSSDFLMQLQLTGAQKENNFASLQVQLPAIVIGGGLTAIDCSTELLAYYPVQVEKILARYEKISSEKDERYFWKQYSESEKEIIKTFIEHAKIVREEKAKAEAEGRHPDLTSLVREWGGVKLIYRKRLNDAPSYRENHEEIIEALEQGVQFAELLSPSEFVKNDNGAVESVVFEKQEAVFNEEKNRYSFKGTGESITIPAKTVIVAAGTSANMIYDDEHPGTFELDEWKSYYKPFTAEIINGKVELKPAEDKSEAFFTSYNNEGKLVSFFGDSHPHYYGTVVTAMASASHGAPHIKALFKNELEELDNSPEAVKQRAEIHDYFSTMLDSNLRVTVKSVKKLNDKYTELVINAPLMSDKFRPGQFFKLQNYECTAGKLNGSLLTSGNLALFGCGADPANGTITLIVDDHGVSSHIASSLKEGDRVFLSGPGGSPLDIPKGKTVLLAGEDFGNPALIPVLKELKENGNKTLLFAYYRDSSDAIKVEELEELADQIVWCYSEGGEVLRGRNEDLTCNADIGECMKNYVTGNLGGRKKIEFNDVSSIIVIGSPDFLDEVRNAKKELKDYFGEVASLGSVNSPMQCMMKGVCADCMQRLVDPETGEEKFVYSCAEQFQDLDCIDIENLKERLTQNSAMDKVNLEYFRLISDGKTLQPVK